MKVFLNFYTVSYLNDVTICLHFFQVVIGAAGNQLPDPPKARSKFVIGAAANGAEVTRPLSRSRQPAVGAADTRPRQASRPAPRRSQTVIGAAAGQSSSRPAPHRRPEPSTSRSSDSGSRRDFIVIGLRNNRKRRSMYF